MDWSEISVGQSKNVKLTSSFRQLPGTGFILAVFTSLVKHFDVSLPSDLR